MTCGGALEFAATEWPLSPRSTQSRLLGLPSPCPVSSRFNFPAIYN